MTSEGSTGGMHKGQAHVTRPGAPPLSPGEDSASSGHWAARLGPGFWPGGWKPFPAFACSPPAALASRVEWV